LSLPPFAGAAVAQFVPAPRDGVLPERFFSTSNLPTYVRLEDGWHAPTRPRMDCAIVRRGNTLETVEPRRVRAGDAVLVALDEHGTEGVVVHTAGFLGGSHGANEFQFMGTEVSRERPVNYEDLAQRLRAERDAGGYVLWIAGPALVHSRARND